MASTTFGKQIPVTMYCQSDYWDVEEPSETKTFSDAKQIAKYLRLENNDLEHLAKEIRTQSKAGEVHVTLCPASMDLYDERNLLVEGSRDKLRYYYEDIAECV